MRALWRNRDYMVLWSGQLVSVLGTSVSQLALPLLVLALTRSPAQTGLAALLETLPYVILALPAGALVDRWNRKSVMIVADGGRFVAFGVIPLAAATGHLSVPLIYAAVTLHGILMTFFSMAEVAALAQVVTREQLPRPASGPCQQRLPADRLRAQPTGSGPGRLAHPVGRCRSRCSYALVSAGSDGDRHHNQPEPARGVGHKEMPRPAGRGISWLRTKVYGLGEMVVIIQIPPLPRLPG